MKLPRLNRSLVPMLATAFVFVVLYAGASFEYPQFSSTRNNLALFQSNAALGIVAVGMTLVILAEGIDLSVGAIVGCTSIMIAGMISQKHISPWVAWSVALVLGTLLGAGMGYLIHAYEMPAFMVTLGGMFFARGAGFFVTDLQITIDHPVYRTILNTVNRTVYLHGPPNAIGNPTFVYIPIQVFIFLAILLLGTYIAQYTRTGRTIYAIGGNENSAILMGLPVARTKIFIYAFSGFCSALAGIVTTFDTNSGDPQRGIGMELNAIAAVVIGGTLLTGGQGYVFGTLLGVLIYGSITTLISFNGHFDSSAQPIFVGGLLLIFILLQKFLSRTGRARG